MKIDSIMPITYLRGLSFEGCNGVGQLFCRFKWLVIDTNDYYCDDYCGGWIEFDRGPVEMQVTVVLERRRRWPVETSMKGGKCKKLVV